MTPKQLSVPSFFRDKGDLRVYEFPNLAHYPNLCHGIFTRISGFSNPPFSGLNVGLEIGDRIDHVHRNRACIAACLKTAPHAYARQVHGTGVLTFRQNTTPSSGLHHPEGDAMITDIPGKILAVKTADCQPILLFDPARQVVANIHCGWRGSIQNIIQHTLEKMNADFNSHPADIIAGIGPSLGPCCSEFIHYRKEIPEMYWKYKIRENHFDFWAISRDQLTNAGVHSENIHISSICTSCNTDLFFSYRKEGVTGRFASVIGLKPV